jgi:hypothetical protein
MPVRLGSTSPPRVQPSARLPAPECSAVLRPHLRALARFGTKNSSAALTSFDVRGFTSRSLVPPTPPATPGCACKHSPVGGQALLSYRPGSFGSRPPGPLARSGVTGSPGCVPGRNRSPLRPECRLTCRSTGASTAWHPGREALSVHVAPRGQGTTPFRPGYLHVRRHELHFRGPSRCAQRCWSVAGSCRRAGAARVSRGLNRHLACQPRGTVHFVPPACRPWRASAPRIHPQRSRPSAFAGTRRDHSSPQLRRRRPAAPASSCQSVVRLLCRFARAAHSAATRSLRLRASPPGSAASACLAATGCRCAQNAA